MNDNLANLIAAATATAALALAALLVAILRARGRREHVTYRWNCWRCHGPASDARRTCWRCRLSLSLAPLKRTGAAQTRKP